MAKEIWKDIKGYEGLYQVSSLGRVKSLSRKTTKGKILKQTRFRNYLGVILSKNNIKKVRNVHRLVAETFIPNPNNYPQVNHKDENPRNNSVSNLEWCTSSYNINYGNRNNKVSSKLGKRVLCIETGIIYNSTMDAISALRGFNNYTQGHIADCCRGVRNKAFGYHWKYLEKDNKEILWIIIILD